MATIYNISDFGWRPGASVTVVTLRGLLAVLDRCRPPLPDQMEAAVTVPGGVERCHERGAEGRMTGDIHVCRGVNRHYIAQTRQAGYRRWSTVVQSEDYQGAVMAMAQAFCSRNAKRGRVLMTADYYDPIVVAEMHR
jgi:hypothetical protein